MAYISIKNLGVGALVIETDTRRILVDAFNSITDGVSTLPGDILIFTHDDGDHFSSDHLPSIKGKDCIIIGPPSIIKPILLRDKAEIEQIQVVHSNRFAEPASYLEGDIRITSYKTNHFNHWDPIHNSYLIEIGDKKIYITGDSLMSREMAEIIGPTNAIVCNLVDEDYLKGNRDTEMALHNLFIYLEKVCSESNTGIVIGVHLIGFEWTVNEKDLKELVDKSNYRNIFIPISTDERILC